MVKLKYNTIGECVDCGAYTSIDVETNLCEGCVDNTKIFNKGMTFLDAIQKYDKITNDGGETYYYKNNEGYIYKNYDKGLSCSINANIDFLLSTGWKEYKNRKLALPKRRRNESYYFINADRTIGSDMEHYLPIDDNKFNNYNSFTDKSFAKYIADKQLIHRINLVLKELNKDRFDKADLQDLINEYIRNNYSKVLNRITEYESK